MTLREFGGRDEILRPRSRSIFNFACDAQRHRKAQVPPPRAINERLPRWRRTPIAPTWRVGDCGWETWKTAQVGRAIALRKLNSTGRAAAAPGRGSVGSLRGLTRFLKSAS